MLRRLPVLYSNKKMAPPNTKEILAELKKHSNPEDKYGMERFGIKTSKAFGVRMPVLRDMGKKIGVNHELALQLWKEGYRETKILAGLIADIGKVDWKLADSWITDFESWEDCDQTCMNLFWKLPTAFEKAIGWSERKREFERRAGFALMAVLAWKDKKAEDKEYEKFFPVIKKYSTDERNFVKKAVNWALRQIGKRNLVLNQKAIEVAEEILKINDKTASWIAKAALRELKGEAVQERLKKNA